MSRSFTVLRKDGLTQLNGPEEALQALSADAVARRTGRYSEMLGHLFQHPSAVAITACGMGIVQAGICDGLAAELSDLGKQVVIVPVSRPLLENRDQVVDEISLTPGISPNVWVWPPAAHQVRVFSTRSPVDGENWLQRLRRGFHTVILDCPAVEDNAEVGDISAMADFTLLVVEADRTTRQQIKRDQLALQMKGAQIAGSIFVRGRSRHAIP